MYRDTTLIQQQIDDNVTLISTCSPKSLSLFSIWKILAHKCIRSQQYYGRSFKYF